MTDETLPDGTPDRMARTIRALADDPDLALSPAQRAAYFELARRHIAAALAKLDEGR